MITIDDNLEKQSNNYLIKKLQYYKECYIFVFCKIQIFSQ